ncbi:hypothetical protein OLMES_2798 [Oleiphilus messinensis]|uniref:Uncharacterized protein n=1 Tax=Oleiphilus messinensis TaxID=141451 RepID=A0A1Y0IAR4_9GAMM|nr:hypothetical protein [Oleiphilus messinensis]ARU56846.1 hypothetical protein OLMES_2798 [Oleiphilus messinensis]
MKSFIPTLSIAIITLILLTVFTYLPVGSNLWHVMTSNGYIIPKESSLFSFQVIEMNQGSGEWWTYGRDDQYYYHFLALPDRPYVKIPTASTVNCPGFIPNQFGTWCLQHTR